jgi:hypothetical protein
MGVTAIPTAVGGGIKLVQRGQAVSSGNITITSVVTTKTFVRSFSEGAAGTVASDSTSTGTLSPTGGAVAGTGFTNTGYGGNINNTGSFADYTGSRTFASGTMNAVTKRMGVHLVDATTITATGPCRYEVVEFA